MQNSKIEWTDHTFNIVWGCIRVSPGCEHCYAETMAKRYGYNVWGPAKTTARREMSANYWRQPLRWNEQARKAGERRRVFCGSMSDVFEDHPTNEWARANLWGLIEQTPNLNWLLLTKRPENIRRMVPWTTAPHNVWLGTSVENQDYAARRIPELIRTPAVVHFLSCEPLLGPVDLSPWMVFEGQYEKAEWMLAKYGASQPLDWIIAGGESGPKARPAHPDWFRSLRDQCRAGGVAFHFKQWGEYRPSTEQEVDAWVHQDDWRCKWIDDEGRLFHGVYGGMAGIYKAGKHAAGRLLDGREWNELPQYP